MTFDGHDGQEREDERENQGAAEGRVADQELPVVGQPDELRRLVEPVPSREGIHDAHQERDLDKEKDDDHRGGRHPEKLKPARPAGLHRCHEPLPSEKEAGEQCPPAVMIRRNAR